MSTMLATIATAWTRAWSDGETAAFEEITSPDYVRISKTGREHLPEVLTQIRESHDAFTGFTMEILHAVEDGDMIAIHWKSSGRHTGTFMDVPPTGRTVTVQGAAFLRHRDNRITEETVVWDPRELLSAMNIWHIGTRRPGRRTMEGVPT
ncbi:ester cyclase [Spiractinospora alimapuensis]|uniref:ester cyclase n=1 Tax=Spiractinospora alimapuensis TaxID=2820884 RepID=UPI001F3AAA2C|nr:ester cyclase [Spiractinospora alimapuensis]QVQ51735.1 ester cyclase [Spiractinospora alimapuensis]